MKGVAMSAGRHWIKEFYVGFLLLLLSFLYLSHLSAEFRSAELSVNEQATKPKWQRPAVARGIVEEKASSISRI